MVPSWIVTVPMRIAGGWDAAGASDAVAAAGGFASATGPGTGFSAPSFCSLLDQLLQVEASRLHG